MNELLPVCGDISVVNQPPNTSLYSPDGFMSESSTWATINHYQHFSLHFWSTCCLNHSFWTSEQLGALAWLNSCSGLTKRDSAERDNYTELHRFTALNHFSVSIHICLKESLVLFISPSWGIWLWIQHMTWKLNIWTRMVSTRKDSRRRRKKKKSSHETQNWFHLTVSNRLRQWGSSLPAHCCYAAWSLTHMACSLLFKQPAVLDGKAMLVTEVTALCLWHTALSIWVARRDPRYLHECFCICMWEMGVFVCIAMKHTLRLSQLEMCKRKCKRKTCLRGECFEEMENLMV